MRKGAARKKLLNIPCYVCVHLEKGFAIGFDSVEVVDAAEVCQTALVPETNRPVAAACHVRADTRSLDVDYLSSPV